MTIKDYITAKLKPLRLTLSEADWDDIDKDISVEAENTPENIDRAFRSLAVNVLPFYVNQAKSVSENGFSISFDGEGLFTFYDWLCSKLNIDNILEKKPTVRFL